jgi:DNA polymerase III delta prime subunit
MASRFSRAVREKAFARVLVYGLPGSGKTRGCLELARALVGQTGKVALIDAEPEAPAHYYADLVADGFDRAAVAEATVAEYRACLYGAADEGYGAVVVDGLTPAWELLSAWHDALAEKSGNSFAAWGPVGAEADALLRDILTYPGHIIVTAQAKEKSQQVGTKIESMGIAPICRSRDPYRFDHQVLINEDHSVRVDKSRCPELDGWSGACLWQGLPEKLLSWCNAGESAEAVASVVRSLVRAGQEGSAEAFAAAKAGAGRLVKSGAVRPAQEAEIRRAMREARAALDARQPAGEVASLEAAKAKRAAAASTEPAASAEPDRNPMDEISSAYAAVHAEPTYDPACELWERACCLVQDLRDSLSDDERVLAERLDADAMAHLKSINPAA